MSNDWKQSTCGCMDDCEICKSFIQMTYIFGLKDETALSSIIFEINFFPTRLQAKLKEVSN